MFYFLYGNSPMIEFETEKKTEEILEKVLFHKKNILHSTEKKLKNASKNRKKSDLMF